MKRVLLLILLLILFFSLSVDAKLKFGGWSKWDEELPLAGKYWNNAAFYTPIKNIDRNELTYIEVNRYICDKKNCEKIISAILFSPKNASKEDIFKGIADYQLAIVAFPPENNLITIRAYKKEANQDNLKFFEEWTCPFENNYSVLNNKYKNQFVTEYHEWLGMKLWFDIRLFILGEKFTLLYHTYMLDGKIQDEEVLGYLKANKIL